MVQKSPLRTPWRDEITSDCSIMQHPRWCTLGKVTRITVRRSKAYRLQMRYPAKYLIWLNPDSRACPFVSPMKVRETFSRELLTEADVCLRDGQDTQPPPNCWGLGWSRGNKWWRYEKKVCLLLCLEPTSSAGSAHISAFQTFSGLLLHKGMIWNALTTSKIYLDITGNPTDIWKLLLAFYYRLSFSCSKKLSFPQSSDHNWMWNPEELNFFFIFKDTKKFHISTANTFIQ